MYCSYCFCKRCYIIHLGRPVGDTWTLLGENALPGESEIKLKSPVGWYEGDEIVIATTGNQMSQRENEKRRIAGISADRKTLTLDEPLEYIHLGLTGYCSM